MPSAAKRQRKKQGKQAKAEQLRRQAQAARRRRITILVLLLLFGASAAAVSLMSRDDGSPDAAPSSTAGGCPTAEPPMTVNPASTYHATFETSQGPIVIELDSERAPKTVNSFVALANCGFYDGTTFHRVDKEFVIQGGDPTGTGSGGPDYKVVEAPPADLKYTPGVVAMAKTGAEAPGTSGSQFFIVTGTKVPDLPPDYALLGKVISGQDGAVEKIRSTAVEGEKPVEQQTITKVTVTEVAPASPSPSPAPPA
ncbi:MAG: peptidylprolyl isomerase [Actinomycetota bacterium]